MASGDRIRRGQLVRRHGLRRRPIDHGTAARIAGRLGGPRRADHRRGRGDGTTPARDLRILGRSDRPLLDHHLCRLRRNSSVRAAAGHYSVHCRSRSSARLLPDLGGTVRQSCTQSSQDRSTGPCRHSGRTRSRHGCAQGTRPGRRRIRTSPRRCRGRRNRSALAGPGGADHSRNSRSVHPGLDTAPDGRPGRPPAGEPLRDICQHFSRQASAADTPTSHRAPPSRCILAFCLRSRCRHRRSGHLRCDLLPPDHRSGGARCHDSADLRGGDGG